MQTDLKVGVLDIFGFENFDVNSFEQLCINVANEQLQRYFNEHIFTAELTELKAEGIAAPTIDYADNSLTLELFLKRTSGLFSILDEESYFPRGTYLILHTGPPTRSNMHTGPSNRMLQRREGIGRMLLSLHPPPNPSPPSEW